jgi:hypothetical protein
MYGHRKICPSCARFSPGWQTCRWCKTPIVVVNDEVKLRCQVPECLSPSAPHSSLCPRHTTPEVAA